MSTEEKYLLKRFLVFLAVIAFWYALFLYPFITGDPLKGVRELMEEEKETAHNYSASFTIARTHEPPEHGGKNL